MQKPIEFKPDMRGVKLASQKCYVRSRSPICERCAVVAHCKMDQRGLTRMCHAFVPAFVFRAFDGIEGGSIFNTLRVGEAWPKRLYVGKRVACVLVNGSRRIVKTVMCETIDWFSGLRAPMLERHSLDNHMFLRRTFTSKHAAAAEMDDLLARSFGPMIYNAHDSLTAIYMRALPQEHQYAQNHGEHRRAPAASAPTAREGDGVSAKVHEMFGPGSSGGN